MCEWGGRPSRRRSSGHSDRRVGNVFGFGKSARCRYEHVSLLPKQYKKPTSETQPHTKLQSAHRSRRGDNAKACGRSARRRNTTARLAEVRVVEGIRGIAAQRQLEALAQIKVARDGQIDRLITRPIEKIPGRVAISGSAGDDLVLSKGGSVEPHLRRWIGKVGIADQLCPVVGAAVEVRVDVAVGNCERKTAAKLDDGRDAPAIQDAPHDMTASFEVIGPVSETCAEDVPLVRVAGAHFFRKDAVVLCQPLIRAVVKLSAAQGLAVGVERVEDEVVTHAHGAGNLQTFVEGRL